MVDLFLALVLILCGALLLIISPMASASWLSLWAVVVGLGCFIIAGRIIWEETR